MHNDGSSSCIRQLGEVQVIAHWLYPKVLGVPEVLVAQNKMRITERYKGFNGTSLEMFNDTLLVSSK